MSKLTNHVKSDKVKWAITAIAFVLAFVMLIGVVLQVFMPEGKKLTDWFNKTEQEEPLPEENGGAVIDQASDNGVKVMTAKIAPEQYAEYGVSALAENAYTLTATVSGDADAAVTYSAAWKNPSSEWATGKTVSDYVTVSQGSVGSQTATVSVLQAFSEQVIITCVVTDYPEFSATCTVDYVATFKIELPTATNLADVNSKFNFKISEVEGTLACDMSGVLDITFTIYDSVYTALQSSLGSGVLSNSFTVTDEDLSVAFNFDGFEVSSIYSALDVFELYFEKCITGVSREDYYNTLYKACNLDSLSLSGLAGWVPDVTGCKCYSVKYDIERMYNDSSYGTVASGSTVVTIMDASDFPTYASGIELDNSSIIAG